MGDKKLYATTPAAKLLMLTDVKKAQGAANSPEALESLAYYHRISPVQSTGDILLPDTKPLKFPSFRNVRQIGFLSRNRLFHFYASKFNIFLYFNNKRERLDLNQSFPLLLLYENRNLVRSLFQGLDFFFRQSRCLCDNIMGDTTMK